MRPIVNIDQLELVPWGNGDKYVAKYARIAPRVGARLLGYSVTVLPPGKAAFPFHSHRVNEEMFFVLDGEGEVRIGGERHPIRKGDVIACPPRGPAHQIVNTSSAELRYLAVSTQMFPEVADYPDTGKVGILAERVKEDGAKEIQRLFGREGTPEEYWKGE